MSNNFSRTLRALRADGLTGWTVRALLAALLLAVWVSWFLLGRITLWAVSESAQAQMSDEPSSVESPVEGSVVEVHMSRGQSVNQGDVLVELEAIEEEGERETLVAELGGDYARRIDLNTRIQNQRRAREQWLDSSQSGIDEASARVTEAEAAANLAVSEEARALDLFRQNLVSQEQLDRAVAARRTKEAQAESARAAARRAEGERQVDLTERNTEIENLKGDLEVLNNNIVAKETEISNLEQAVGMRRIRAPASGDLAQVAQLQPGALVEAGDLLARIVPSGEIRAVAWFQPAEALGRIRAGQPARLRLDAFPSTQFGTIPATVAIVDSEATDGRIRVDLELDAARPANIELQHEMPGRVEVEVDRVSPASLLMRAVGKLLDQPASERTGSPPEAGSAD